MKTDYWSKVLDSRVSRRRALAASGVAALGAGLLAACGGDGQGTSAQKDKSGLVTPIVDETKNVKRGGVLKTRHANPSVGNFDPHSGTTSEGGSDGTRFYRPLFTLKEGYMEPTNGDIVGDVVESWELSPDKLTITAKINPDAHFAPVAPVNGRSVDARDVAFTWERYRTIGTRRSDYANEVNPVAPVVSITAVDDRTIVIKLSEPQATIFSLLSAGPLIAPREGADEKVLDLKQKPIGSAPFMLKEWIPSVGIYYKRNPEYKQDKRGLPYVDEVELPYLSEYATALAQLRVGALHQLATSTSNNVNAEDVLPMKRDVPELDMMPTVGNSAFHTFFGHLPDSPFRDERVRQAYVMTWDRDAFNDVWFNVSKFAAEGLSVETVWDSALAKTVWRGWHLDPKSKEFGPNVKYLKYDLAEAKKLLAAAGYPNGLDTVVHYPPTGFSSYWYKEAEIVLGMVQESGLFRLTRDLVNYSSGWEKYRFSKGQFSQVALTTRGGGWGDVDPVVLLFLYHNSKGSLYQGGDATMDELTLKATREFDFNKRQALAHEVQRYEGRMMFYPRIGSGTRYMLSWPVIRNKEVWQGGDSHATVFIDPEKPPLKRI